MNDEILKALAAAYQAGYTRGVAASEGGFIDDADFEAGEWLKSEDAHEVLQMAGVSSASS